MLTDLRKIVAWLAWSLCLLCVVLCDPLLWFLNGRPLIEFVWLRHGWRTERGRGETITLQISMNKIS